MPASPAWLLRQRPVERFSGESAMLYQGDLHRYSELSPCHPFEHGSLEDIYRYALDVAQLDFIAVTDPAPAPGSAGLFQWRMQQKLADLFTVRGRMAALQAYEREGTSPAAVLCGTPWSAVPVPGATWLGDALAVRYAQPGTGQEAATAMPLAAPFDDPALCVLQGGPRQPTSGGQAAPARWEFATQRASCLAAGTGHGGSGLLTYVWAGYLARSVILQALTSHGTYIAPPGLVVRFTASDRLPVASIRPSLMGVTLRVRASGAAGPTRVDVLRDGEVVGTAKANESGVAEFYYHVSDDGKGHAFCARIVTDDGKDAWTTPLWVEPAAKPVPVASKR